MKISRRTALIAASLVVAAGLGGAAIAANQSGPPGAAASHSDRPAPTASGELYRPPTTAEIAALPEANYSAVIPGLVGYQHTGVPSGMTAAYTIAADAPLYGSNFTTAVARLTAKNFLGTSTIVVPVQSKGGWSLVLTPSRKTLPSKSPDSPAQSAGWIRTDLLTKAQNLVQHVVISVGKQTVSVEDSSGKVLHTYPAAVGAAKTPTPTGVVGYVQARYLDPAQDQSVYPITLTSLHSSAADEPFGGKDGGLIGVHYYSVRTGAISHGCVRVAGDVVTALDTLPLGTPIVIQP